MGAHDDGGGGVEGCAGVGVVSVAGTMGAFFVW